MIDAAFNIIAIGNKPFTDALFAWLFPDRPQPFDPKRDDPVAYADRLIALGLRGFGAIAREAFDGDEQRLFEVLNCPALVAAGERRRLKRYLVEHYAAAPVKTEADVEEQLIGKLEELVREQKRYQ